MTTTEVLRDKGELIITVEFHELDALMQGSIFQITTDVFQTDISEIKQCNSLCVLIRKNDSKEESDSNEDDNKTSE